MNSVFNLSTNNLNFMTDAELVDYLHTEGFSTLPPIVKALTNRLEACLEARLEERLDVNQNVCRFVADVKNFNKKYKKAAARVSDVVSVHLPDAVDPDDYIFDF